MSEMPSSLASSTPRPPLRLRRWIFALLVVLLAVMLHWLIFQGQERTPSVVTRPLGPCDVIWFSNRGNAVVMACPHTDMIKLWPLPVEQPWWEDSPFLESVRGSVEEVGQRRALVLGWGRAVLF